jgi:GNAT superfamily N-acetyltransferase
MEIRRAAPDDVEILFDIRCSVRENLQSREELAGLGITPESVAEMLRTDCAAWIGFIDNRAAAFSMANRTEKTVFAMFVRPECEGRGLGRALMGRVEEWFRLHGVLRPWLTTGADPGLRANGFYLHLDWVPDGKTVEGDLRYVKHLE